jgi:alkanesulfonate monooxygenase SsuD/methylene tetrahydromethanopterin reductase-like flavin-dependent oxidoreductase (luciferase family)
MNRGFRPSLCENDTANNDRPVDAAIQRVARIGDAWMIVPSTPLGEVVEQMRTYRAALAETGRKTDAYPIIRECYVGANQKTAFEECRGPLQYKYDAYAASGVAAKDKPPFEQCAKDRFIIGDAAFVQEEIASYRETLGVDHFMMRCQWPGLDQERVLGSIRRLGQIFAAA